MANKNQGRNKYCPPNVLNELKNIMHEEDITKECEGFNKMVKYSQLGREVKKMRDRFLLRDVFRK